MKTRIQEIEATLERLVEFVRRRDLSLSERESHVLCKIASKQLSFLNPGSRNQRLTYVQLAGAAMELECKINRRGLFFLHMRQRKLTALLASLKAELDTLEDRAQ